MPGLLKGLLKVHLPILAIMEDRGIMKRGFHGAVTMACERIHGNVGYVAEEIHRQLVSEHRISAKAGPIEGGEILTLCEGCEHARGAARLNVMRCAKATAACGCVRISEVCPMGLWAKGKKL